MWIILGILSAISAAFVAIFGKLGLSSLDSTIATTIRAGIMTLFLIGISTISGKFQTILQTQLSTKQWMFIIASGIVGALSWLAFFAALQTGEASKVSALDRTSIIFVIILSAVFLGENLGWKSLLGSMLIVCGVLLVTWK